MEQMIIVISSNDIGGLFNPYGVVVECPCIRFEYKQLRFEIRVAKKFNVWASASSLHTNMWGYSSAVHYRDFKYRSLTEAVYSQVEVAKNRLAGNSMEALIPKVDKWLSEFLSLSEEEKLRMFTYE